MPLDLAPPPHHLNDLLYTRAAFSCPRPDCAETPDAAERLSAGFGAAAPLTAALGFTGVGVSTALGFSNRGKEQTVDTGNRVKRLAWVVIVALIGCFSYSIGFQSGWSDATDRYNLRLDQVTTSLQEMVNQPAAEDPGAGMAGDTAVARW